jgi:hypothetical protein
LGEKLFHDVPIRRQIRRQHSPGVVRLMFQSESLFGFDFDGVDRLHQREQVRIAEFVHRGAPGCK